MTNETAEHSACKLYIHPICCAVGKQPEGAHRLPVKIECITEEGECFAIAMTRRSWAQLILGDHEVDGWIEPLEADDDPRD